MYRLIYARNIAGRAQWMEIVVASRKGKWVEDQQKLSTAYSFEPAGFYSMSSYDL